MENNMWQLLFFTYDSNGIEITVESKKFHYIFYVFHVH